MGLLNIIRRMSLREKLSIREIARRTGISRDTITKYLTAGTIEPHFTTPERQSKLDPFAEKLAGWLKTEAGKSRKQRRTLKHLHADLVALGFIGSYNRVAAFARDWRADRQREQQTTGRGTFVPLTFRPGAQWAFKKPNAKDPWGIRVTLGSTFMATLGLGAAKAHLDDVLNRLSIRTRPEDFNMSRVDYWVDILAPADFKLDPELFVMHSSTNRRDHIANADMRVQGKSARVTSVKRREALKDGTVSRIMRRHPYCLAVPHREPSLYRPLRETEFPALRELSAERLQSASASRLCRFQIG